MGQAKKNRDRIFAASGGMCVYCGGIVPATTLDHMPAIVMFDGRDRPAGLEFASCGPCNHGAGLADLTAALIGRVYPDGKTEEQLGEVQKLLGAVKNNVPGLLEEMHVPRHAEQTRKRQLGLPAEGGLLRLGGPLVLGHLEAFGARLGLALHFHHTGLPVPLAGGVYVRVFSNVDLIEGKIPKEIFQMLPEASTLAQGRKNVEEQFKYAVCATDTANMTMSYASFRFSFSVLTFAATDILLFDPQSLEEGSVLYRPGSLQEIDARVATLRLLEAAPRA